MERPNERPHQYRRIILRAQYSTYITQRASKTVNTPLRRLLYYYLAMRPFLLAHFYEYTGLLLCLRRNYWRISVGLEEINRPAASQNRPSSLLLVRPGFSRTPLSSKSIGLLVAAVANVSSKSVAAPAGPRPSKIIRIHRYQIGPTIVSLDGS